VKSYTPTAFFEFLGYGSGDHTYNCPGLRSLSVYCRGNRGQLVKLLEPTPFELADDRFLVSVADFANNSTTPYFDAAVILAVRYGDHVGGNYYFEWEDKHTTVAAGRELWGYPKHFARISLDDDAAGVLGRVSLEGDTSFEVEMTFDDQVTGAAWSDISFYPHLQVRAVPEANGPSFQSFDIISRNTAKDFKLSERRYGRAVVKFGPEIQAGGEPLEILETLGAEYTVGDFFATRQNGTPKIVASLV
jgi:acetoacetate decarboxylase